MNYKFLLNYIPHSICDQANSPYAIPMVFWILNLEVLKVALRRELAKILQFHGLQLQIVTRLYTDYIRKKVKDIEFSIILNIFLTFVGTL